MIKLADKKKTSLRTLGNLAPKVATPEPAHELQPEVSLVSAFVDQIRDLGVEQAFASCHTNI